MITYEQKLNRDRRWAFLEGSMHFEKESAVHKTLERVARRLEELHIPYAVVGGMAMFYHGYRRFTEDVDLLVTPEGLRQLHDALEGRGYLPPFSGSKHLRDTDSGVRVEFLVTGGYPGDGKAKSIVFPDPLEAGQMIGDIRCLRLPRLIELKLASGMSNPGRRRDLADVQELIRTLDLPAELGNQLDASVEPLYQQLWKEVHENPN